MELEEVQYIKEKIMIMNNKEMDSYIMIGIKKYVSYCQNHDFKGICEPIIMRHYENISDIKEATEDDYLIENLDWDE